jgi:hypothetical protein
MTSMNVYGNAADAETAAIFDWVLHGKGNGTWQSKLLAKLLFSPPIQDFGLLIDDFLKSHTANDTFFVALKTWMAVGEGSYELGASSIGNADDHLTHWLVALVERMYLLANGVSENDLRGSRVAGGNFDELSVKLSQQFLREHSDGSDHLCKALLVLLFTDDSLQEKTMIDSMAVISRLIAGMQDNGHSLNLPAFQQHVGISPDYMRFAKAQEKVISGQFESALLDYVELQKSGVLTLNFAEMAFKLFKQHIAVKYFSSVNAINKLLPKPMRVNLPLKRDESGEPEGFSFSKERRAINRVLTGLKANSAHINDWNEDG